MLVSLTLRDRIVLGNYARADIDDVTAMLASVSAEAEGLAKGDDARFMNEGALRMQDD